MDFFLQLASRFLHAFPPLTVHLFRWGLIQNKHIRYGRLTIFVEKRSLGNLTDLLRLEDDLWDSESFGAAVGLYLVWQIGYWVVTEVTNISSCKE